VDLASPADDDQLLAVNEALDKLAAEHKTEAELVKLRYFVGMTNEEAAEVLGISPRTAKYYWTHARAWLYREITRRQPAAPTYLVPPDRSRAAAMRACQRLTSVGEEVKHF